MAAQWVELSVEKVLFAEDFNTRTDLGDLTDLKSSIEAVGVREPILVKDRENNEGEYEVFAGFRRLEASKLAGKKTIPAMVYARRDVTRKDMLVLNVTENIQREDLNPVDEAEAYQRMKEQHSMTVEEICTQCGVRKARVQQRMRLLKMSDVVREALRSNRIQVNAATEIDRLPKDRQGKFVELAEELSGVRLHSLVDKELEKIRKKADSGDAVPAADDDDKPTVKTTELARMIRKCSQVVCNGLGYDDETKTRVKDVNFRLLEEFDMEIMAKFFDDLADAVPEDLDFNEKGSEEIASAVEGMGNATLDIESPIVRQALIKSVKARAEEIAREESDAGKRVKVTYAIAKRAIQEFVVAPE